MKRLVAVQLLALVLTSSAWAEVRLAGEKQGLRVQLTSSGPWAPVGAVDDAVLNPEGDLKGDGSPAWAAHGGDVLAAWASPTDATLRLALARGEGWAAQSRLSGETVLGTPRVARLGEAWLVAWMRENPLTNSVETRLATVSEAGQLGEAWSVMEGRLVDLTVTGDTAHVIVAERQQPASQLSAETLVFASHLPGIPQPITRARWDFGRFVEPSAAGDEAWWPAPVTLGLTDEPDSGALFAWWPQAGELRFVVLDHAGPVLPVASLSASGQAKRPQGLLKRAARLVQQR